MERTQRAQSCCKRWSEEKKSLLSETTNQKRKTRNDRGSKQEAVSKCGQASTGEAGSYFLLQSKTFNETKNIQSVDFRATYYSVCSARLTLHANTHHVIWCFGSMCFYFHTNQSFSLETVFSLLSVPVVPLCRFKSVWFVWSLLALYSQVLFLRCHWNTFTFCALPWTDQRISAVLRLTWTILGKTEEPEDSQSTFLPSPTAVGSTGELEGSSSR